MPINNLELFLNCIVLPAYSWIIEDQFHACTIFTAATVNVYKQQRKLLFKYSPTTRILINNNIP